MKKNCFHNEQPEDNYMSYQSKKDEKWFDGQDTSSFSQEKQIKGLAELKKAIEVEPIYLPDNKIGYKEIEIIMNFKERVLKIIDKHIEEYGKSN